MQGAREFVLSVLTCRITLGCAKPPSILDELETDSPPWSTSMRPLIVDLIAWPSLRDQMVFHSSFYDLDEMTEDIVNNTVVDMPEQHVALKMYSNPPKTIPTVPRPAESDEPFRFSQQEWAIKILQMQNQELFDIIARRMGLSKGVKCEDHPFSDPLAASQVQCLSTRTDPAKKFRGWKLSRAFFDKYPFLQCSSRKHPQYPVCGCC